VSLFLYNLFLAVYRLAIGLAAPFHAKARMWLRGRRGWRRQLPAALRATAGRKRLWVHCASLGEFEQGRPLIEALRKEYPQLAIVLTFFSPSGYGIRKDYPHADHVFYLPPDGKRNAAVFIREVNPVLAVFVKYEFWYYYLHTLGQRNIPAILVSAAFRPAQPFFRWYGGMFRQLLRYFSLIFVQHEAAAALLAGIGLREQVIVAGDTRYDRVVEIAAGAGSFPVIAAFKGAGRLVVAGSTWPADEQLLRECLSVLPAGWKLVIAPHEIDAPHIRRLLQLFEGEAVVYSSLQAAAASGKRVLVIDNIGILSALYRYGAIAYVGGGFQKGGIHNILEPAVFGLPVLFGPNYRKFAEAENMVARRYAYPVRDAAACRSALQRLTADTVLREQLHAAIAAYVRQQTGAVDKILAYIRQRRWLA